MMGVLRRWLQAEALGHTPDECEACLSVVRDLSDVLLRRKGAKGSPKFLSPAHVSDSLDDLCQDIPMRCAVSSCCALPCGVRVYRCVCVFMRVYGFSVSACACARACDVCAVVAAIVIWLCAQVP